MVSSKLEEINKWFLANWKKIYLLQSLIIRFQFVLMIEGRVIVGFLMYFSVLRRTCHILLLFISASLMSGFGAGGGGGFIVFRRFLLTDGG